MTIKVSHIIRAVALILLVYYMVVAFMLHYSLDRLVFLHTKAELTNEIDRYHVSDLKGNEVIVRHYGKGENGYVVFFPGQHGNINRYEKTLFEPLTKRGVAVFALSYPGQNGAKGNGNFENVQELVQKALARINLSCPIKDAVFVGRSLGSMVAVMASVQWHPRGLVLEATTPSVSDAICSYMKRKWYLQAATLLPVQRIIKKDYFLNDAMENLTCTNIAIFQGTNDYLASADNIKEICRKHSNVSIFAVNGAMHSNAYIQAFPLYMDTILCMLNRQSTKHKD